MKYAKYILFLVTLIFASCTIEEPEQGKGSKIQFVGRAVPFNEHDVDTRAQMTDEEAAIKTLDYLIFVYIGTGDKTDFDNWACVFYRHSTNSMEMINKEEDFPNFYDKDSHKFNHEGFNKCYVAIVANYPKLYKTIKSMYTSAQNAPDDIETYIDDAIEYSESGDGTYLKLSEVLVMKQDVPGIFSVPEDGLPRLGNYTEEGSTEEDRNYVNLNNLTPGKPYTVNLKSLYAKMVFDISVDPNQESVHPEVDEVVNNDNTFRFDGYTVYNVPNEIDFDPTTNVVGEESKLTREIEGQGNTNKGFTFYLPERYFSPITPAGQYEYPFAEKYTEGDNIGQVREDEDGNVILRPEDEKLRQRYKPKLVEKADGTTDATYVRFTGEFINHQGHSFNVSYDIYVGSDNYGNFDVVRNTQYNNIITIRGIDNYSDQSNNPDAVSIDHRVNVERSAPVIISFRRETFLDSHFEVRPIRIRAKGTPTQNQAVKLEVKYNVSDPANNTPAARWIGLERSFGNGVAPNTSTKYCIGSGDYGPSSAGKRKYFTTDLTTATLAGGGTFENGLSTVGGQSVVVPVHNDCVHGNNIIITGECVWLYVDECDEEAEASTISGAFRSATIRIWYGSIVDGEFKEESPTSYNDYLIKQHLLFKIDKDQNNNPIGPYYIEYEEEYLYNFDAEDNFYNNQTFDNGMTWGLDGVQLSNKNRAMFMKGGIIGGFTDIVNIIVKSPFYDFYLDSDDYPEGATHYNRQGYYFNTEIIDTLKDLQIISVLALDQKPNSAIEYCYNRNKRNANGQVAETNWYMPAIDELQDIVSSKVAYSEFEEFQGYFYWSCQPAYYRNFAHYNVGIQRRGEYMIDNVNYARATRTVYKNGVHTYAESGMDNFYKVLYMPSTNSNRATLEDIPSTGYVYNYMFDESFTAFPMKAHEGYKHRMNDKCRVRAVRKMN